eukprot:Sspe_Gene.56628::Locus_31138_Transcript_1_2_Confidence_0.667_Length_1850::g.56628::m.56628/K01103/PFKFB3; 6-phosphofructo-2-kinase / fructose-2,6-biphosphatase 3&\
MEDGETRVDIDCTKYTEHMGMVEQQLSHHSEGRIGPSATSGFEATQKFTGRPLAIVTVGLPGRGKSYITRRICRYLNWLGLKTSVFLMQGYRRQFAQGSEPEFFDHNNLKNVEMRDKMVKTAIDEMVQWLREEGGKVAIMDGQNVQEGRRRMIVDELSKVLDPDRILFLEVEENDEATLHNYKELTLKSSSSFRELPIDLASDKFDKRVEFYKQAYEPLTDDYPYIRMVNGGDDIEFNKIRGYVPCRVGNFLMNVSLSNQPIFLSRHGQSSFNELGRIGGDSGLTAFGELYARELAKWVEKNAPPNLEIWCSTLHRTVLTATPMKGTFPIVYWKALEEIDGGIFDGLTYDEIAKQAPEEFEKRKKNKYWYRYPHGESYHDLVARLEPVIMELERSRKPLLIISHQAVLRVIYAYLIDDAPERCTNLAMPLHTVVKMWPTYGGMFEEERIPIVETDKEIANHGTHGKEDIPIYESRQKRSPKR